MKCNEVVLLSNTLHLYSKKNNDVAPSLSFLCLFDTSCFDHFLDLFSIMPSRSEKWRQQEDSGAHGAVGGSRSLFSSCQVVARSGGGRKTTVHTVRPVAAAPPPPLAIASPLPNFAPRGGEQRQTVTARFVK